MRSKNNLVVLFAILIISLGQSMDIYLPSMPAMVNALHTNTLAIQFSLTIGLIGYGAAALIYGPMSDHFGRRRIALIGLVIFIFASLLCAIATNIYLLLIGRALQGAGFASASGVAAPAVCDIYSGEDLVKAFSYVGMAMAMMPVIAPVFGGYLHHYFSWRSPFVFLAIYGVVMFVLFFYWFPETNKSLKKNSINPKDIIKNYISILCHRKYLGFVFCTAFIFSGEISYIINAPFLFQDKLGLSPIQNGWLMLITVSGFLGGTFSSKILCNKFNVIQLSILGCAISVSSASTLLIVALMANMTVITIVLPVMFYMLGVGLIYPNAGAGGMSCFPEKAGIVASLSGMLSLGIGGLITTFVASLHISTLLPLAVVLFLLATLSFAMLLLVKE